MDANLANLQQYITFPQYITAVGALGSAAYGLVDTSKLVRGGPSNHGFGYIRDLVSNRLFAGIAAGNNGFQVGDLLSTLRANWLNGTALDDQKSKAKTLIRLMLNPQTVTPLAAATGIDPARLLIIFNQMAAAQPLADADKDIWGRFDLALTALLDDAYQSADQQYRNCAKGWAMLVSIVLAVFGAWLLYKSQSATATFENFWNGAAMWAGLITGLLATPLAPVAKDLSSTLTAAMQALQLKPK